MTANDDVRPDAGTPDGGAAADDREHAGEREADRLVQLLGRLAMGRDADTHPASDRFYEWWRRELRQRSTSAERTSLEERAAAFAARVTARLALERVAVGRLGGAPTTRAAPVTGPLRTILSAAAAERCAPAIDLGVAAGVGRELWDEAPASWVELPADAPPGQYVVLAVAGDSMEPLLHAGDRILVRVGTDAVRDSIVVARHPDDGYVVKRVEALRGHRIELASLNPAFSPTYVPRRSDCVLGTVVLRWCAHGT